MPGAANRKIIDGDIDAGFAAVEQRGDPAALRALRRRPSDDGGGVTEAPIYGGGMQRASSGALTGSWTC